MSQRRYPGKTMVGAFDMLAAAGASSGIMNDIRRNWLVWVVANPVARGAPKVYGLTREEWLVREVVRRMMVLMQARETDGCDIP